MRYYEVQKKDKQKKSTIRRSFVCYVLVAMCSILGGYGGGKCAAADSKTMELPRDIIITNPVAEIEFTETIQSNPVVSYNGTAVSTGEIPLVQANFVWMADVQGLFVDGLDYDFQVTEVSDKETTETPENIRRFTIRNPRLDTTITFTVGQNTATVNHTTKTLPYPIVLTTDIQTGKTALAIPVVWTLQQSGYKVSATDTAITVTDSVLYYENNYETTYDTAIYSNALEGIYVNKNSQNAATLLHLSTVNMLNSSQIKLSDQQEETAVTITLKKTKNALGAITKSFSGGVLKKIQIAETTSGDTTIKLWYGVKYIYTKQYESKGFSLKFNKTSYSVRVLLPDKVNTEKITTTDQYWKNKFLIVIPGNYVKYYQKNKPINNSSAVKGIKVTKTAANNTKITVTTKKLYGYRITYSKCGYFTLKIGSLKSMYKNIVMLDAGHGGKDHGAKRNGVREKNLNFQILYTRAKKYFDDPNSTVKAFWTRHNDSFINLYARPKYSKKYSADLFVSLHMNSAPSRAARGTEVYFARQNNKRNKAGLTSKIAAKRLLSTLTMDLNMKNRGVKHAGFVVIKHNTVPAVLVELGYVSNAQDRGKLKRASFQNKAAKSLYEGIADIFKEYPTGR